MMIKVSLLVTVTGLAATSVEGFVQQASYCQQKSLSLSELKKSEASHCCDSLFGMMRFTALFLWSY